MTAEARVGVRGLSEAQGSAAGRPLPAVAAVLAIDISSATIAALVAAELTGASALVAVPVTGVAWLFAVAVCCGLRSSLVQPASREVRSVLRAVLLVVAFAGIVAFATSDTSIGPFLLEAVGLTALLSVTGRLAHRAHVQAQLRRGHGGVRTVVVGPPAAITDLLDEFALVAGSDMRVVAACVPDPLDGSGPALSVPVAGDLDDVADVAAAVRAQRVVVAGASELTPTMVRQIAWRLEDGGVELLVAPGLHETALSRVQVGAVGSVPLLSLRPRHGRTASRTVKDALDRALAAAALVGLAPLFLAISVAVRFDSPGPVLFRQVRVGRDGRPFRMLKFRTMVDGAHAMRAELDHLNDHDGVLFKLREDPRITRVGARLRRWSMDELPQLLNVVRGEMSLIGPRPPLPEEVAQYDDSVARRLLVKPGLTGLWQVSGRSDLTWEESVRLDLRYVDNWSLAMDSAILWKTGKAVRNGTGAY